MSIRILEAIEKLKTLFPFLSVCLGISVVMLIVLRVLTRRMWISDRRFRTCGVLYALDPLSAVCLCCSWVQMVTAIQMLVLMKEISPVVIGYYLIPSLVFVFLTRPVKGIPVRFLWMFLQLAGLVAVTLIKGYVADTHSSPVMLGLFYVMAVIVGLFSVYLFFLHVSFVSENKRLRLKQENKEMTI